MPRSAAFCLSRPRRILLVPGIGNSGLEHWQTNWESEDKSSLRVCQRDWDKPVFVEWCDMLGATIASAGPDVLVAAHSLGSLLVAKWGAQTSQSIGGALLVAVPDPTGSLFPSEAIGFSPLPTARLVFPSIVVASTDDPFASIAFAKRCADSWRSRLIEIGPMGHINASSGLGSWREGYDLLETFVQEERLYDRDFSRDCASVRSN